MCANLLPTGSPTLLLSYPLTVLPSYPLTLNVPYDLLDPDLREPVLDVSALTVADITRQLNQRAVSSVELTRAYLDQIAAVDGEVRAFVTVSADHALDQAADADRRIAAGRGETLTGVPIALKDVLSTQGLRTTCSSRILENFVPIYDAHVVERLRDAGAVVLGKTNLDEFAMGSSTENSAFFTTRNPWDLDRVPGGSSGGSAAAVAAAEAPAALGSDTGGSIRQPAALCGIVGLKPTYGRVSRFGLVAFASSLDQIGPMTRTVEDSAILLQTIAGRDPRDSTSADVPVPDYRASLTGDLRGLRLGVPKEYFVPGMEPGVEQALRAAIVTLQDLGATIIWDVSLPHTEYALAVYYLLAPSEASANLARYDGVKYGRRVEGPTMWDEMERTRGEGFGAEVKRRIMLGTYALSAGYYDAYYLKAQKVRTLIKRDFDEAFASFDALITPTSPTVAFPIGARVADPVQMYLSDVCTLPINIAGVCGLSVPAGFSEGLPVGMQILGKPFDESTILKIGHAYERATAWFSRRPALAAGAAHR